MLYYLACLRLRHLLDNSTLNDLALGINKLPLCIYMDQLLSRLGYYFLLNHLARLASLLYNLSLTVDLHYLALLRNLLLRNSILNRLLLLALLPTCLLSCCSLCRGQLQR